MSSSSQPLSELPIGVSQSLQDVTDEDSSLLVAADLDSQTETFNEIMQAVRNASQGVSRETFNEYARQKKMYENFVIAQGWVPEAQRHTIVGPNPHKDSAVWLVAYIMNKCDDRDHTGQMKPAETARKTYGYAQKCRAALGHFWGREPTIGNTWWHLTEKGTMSGNPSLSHLVSTYMVSLRRRKTRDGEAPVSSRAITPDVLRLLYKFNHKPENWEPTPYAPAQRGSKKDDITPVGRRILTAVYCIAFTCLMRIDEVLNMRMRHFASIRRNGRRVLKLELDFRKTNQNGGVKPYYFHRFIEKEAYLCPDRALVDWLEYSGLQTNNRPDAPMFPRLLANGLFSLDKPMTSEQFLELFRCNLCDIEIDPIMYGTHSFRRGGCQWLACDKRWPLRRICDWGGWSTEFNSLTIVKYLISESDDPREAREDFFNTDRVPTVACPVCGRSCSCA